MNNILIVDDDPNLLIGIKEYFEYTENQFEVHTALNGKEAVEILEFSPIDLVVTDLKMPEMDGIELLAFINRDFPNIPTIVMSAFGTPKLKNKIKEMGTLLFLNKPIDLSHLSRVIADELKHILQEGHVNDISPATFLQLIEMEENTCFLEVTGKNDKKGHFYFNRGILHDALQSDMQGEAAVLEMLSWDKVQISFKSLPRKKIPKRINSSIQSLIMKNVKINHPKADATQARPTHIVAEGDKDSAVNHVEAEEKPGDAEDRDQKLTGYGDFDGFLGIGLFDAMGSPLWLHTEKKIDLGQAGPLIVAVMLSAIKASEKTETDRDRSQTIYLETENAHAFIALVDDQFVLPSNEEEMGCHIILIASNTAHIGLVKKKFEAVKKNIFKELKGADPALLRN
jgi:CheY-like chemotaxis protein